MLIFNLFRSKHFVIVVVVLLLLFSQLSLLLSFCFLSAYRVCVCVYANTQNNSSVKNEQRDKYILVFFFSSFEEKNWNKFVIIISYFLLFLFCSLYYDSQKKKEWTRHRVHRKDVERCKLICSFGIFVFMNSEWLFVLSEENGKREYKTGF